jgi:hypothetical protein
VGGGMSITVVRTASGTGTGTNQTLAIDGSGGNFLLVCTGWRRNNSQDLSGVTYNSVALTQRYNDTSGTAFGQGMACFYKTLPSSGSNNIVATYINDSLGGNSIVAALLAGVDTSNPFVTTDQIVGDSGSADTLTANISAGTGNLAIGIGQTRGGSSVTFTLGAGQTNIVEYNGAGSDDSDIHMKMSYEAGSGSATTMSYTYSPAATYNGGMGVIALRAASGGGIVKIAAAHLRKLMMST